MEKKQKMLNKGMNKNQVCKELHMSHSTLDKAIQNGDISVMQSVKRQRTKVDIERNYDLKAIQEMLNEGIPFEEIKRRSGLTRGLFKRALKEELLFRDEWDRKRKTIKSNMVREKSVVN